MDTKIRKMCEKHEVEWYSSVKSKEAIKRKKRKNKKIYDALRYTIICEYGKYREVCRSIMSQLPEGEIKNHWGMRDRAYRGYHIRVSSGLCKYEIQIHNPLSLEYREDKMSREIYKRLDERSNVVEFFLMIYSLPMQLSMLYCILLEKFT